MTETSATRKPASIKDVARIAGVSHSTVSRALRNSPRVNSETIEKIRRIAAESGYRASAVGRSLATRRTNTIGVVVTTITDLFAAEVVSGIEEAAAAHDYSILLANSSADPEREMRVVHTLEERRVDGIVVTASRVGALYVPMLSKMRVPIVLLNNQHLGMVVQWEDRFHGGNRGHTYLGAGKDADPYPDFDTIAHGFGVGARSVAKKADLDAAFEEMINSDGPFVLNVHVPYQEHVLPMIPSGMTVKDIIKA